MKAIFKLPKENGNICFGINRNFVDVDEYYIEMDSDDLNAVDASGVKIGMASWAYQDIDGVFTPLEPDAIQNILDKKLLKNAYEFKLEALALERNRRNNVMPFVYNSNTYVNDEANIQGVKVQILDKPDNDPLPTFIGTPMAGTWLSYNDTFVPFTNIEFRTGLADTYFSMRSHNFTNHGILKSMLKALYETEGTTKEDIENFDITTGWSTLSVEV